MVGRQEEPKPFENKAKTRLDLQKLQGSPVQIALAPLRQIGQKAANGRVIASSGKY